MDLRIGFSKAKQSDLTNYKGEKLLVHSVVIFDEELSCEDEILVVHQWESTFTPQWKDRDIAEATKKAQAIIKSILENGDSDEISYRLEPSTVIIGDQYENDCKVYEV